VPRAPNYFLKRENLEQASALPKSTKHWAMLSRARAFRLSFADKGLSNLFARDHRNFGQRTSDSELKILDLSYEDAVVEFKEISFAFYFGSRSYSRTDLWLKSNRRRTCRFERSS